VKSCHLFHYIYGSFVAIHFEQFSQVTWVMFVKVLFVFLSLYSQFVLQIILSFLSIFSQLLWCWLTVDTVTGAGKSRLLNHLC